MMAREPLQGVATCVAVLLALARPAQAQAAPGGDMGPEDSDYDTYDNTYDRSYTYSYDPDIAGEPTEGLGHCAASSWDADLPGLYAFNGGLGQGLAIYDGGDDMYDV